MLNKLPLGVQQTLLYTIGLVVSKSVSLLMLPYVTRMLNPSEYGTLEVILVFINLGTLFYNLGIAEALMKFSGTSSKAEKIKLYQNCLGATVLVSVIFGLVSLYYSATIALLLPADVTQWEVILTLVTLMLGNIIGVQVCWLRIIDNAKQYLTVSLVRALVQALLVVILLLIGLNVLGVIIASFLSTLITLSLLIYLNSEANRLSFDIHQFKLLFSYGSPLLISGIASFFLMGVDQWWIAKVFGTAIMAEYAIAMKFALLTAFVIQPFYLWWQPKRFQLINNNTELQKNIVITRFGLTFSYIGGSAVLIGSIFAIHFILPDAYQQAIRYLPILILAWLLKNMAETMGFGCFVKHTFWPMMINIISAFLIVVLFYCLIPVMKIYGVLLALIMTYIIRHVLFYCLGQRQLVMKYSVGFNVFMTIFSLQFVMVLFFHQWYLMILFCLLSTIILTCIAYGFGYCPSLKQFLGKVI